MPSVTSSFNGLYSPTLLKKNIKRFWPLWGIYTLGLFFLLPAPILSDIYRHMEGWNVGAVGSGLWSAITSAPLVGAVYAGSVPEWCEWFTPFFHLWILLGHGTGYGVLEAVCYCLVAGCAFTLIALGVYRLRQLERAGDLVTVAWVRPVFQYGFAICVGLAAGILVWEQFFYSTSSWVLMALVILFAVLGAFGGRMLLKKTLRVFADGWRGVAVMAATLALLLVAVRVDFFGYQRWVPQSDQVERVYLSGVDSYPNDSGSHLNQDITDPELIRQVTQVHAGLVADLSRVSPDAPAVRSIWEQDEQGIQTGGSAWLDLNYTMKNGETVTRRYHNVPIYQSELEQAGTYARQLEDLINTPELILAAYLHGQDPAGLEAVDGWLENLRATPVEAAAPESTVTIEVDSESYALVDTAAPGQESTPVLTADQARLLWAAVREDLEAGRIGRRYLLDNAQRRENCYYSDVYLTLAYTETDDDGRRHTGTLTVSVTIQTTSTSTLKVLEELGYRERLSLREGQQFRG